MNADPNGISNATVQRNLGYEIEDVTDTLSDQAFRDEAALRAMQTILSPSAPSISYGGLASAAFDIADVMLRERKKRDD